MSEAQMEKKTQRDCHRINQFQQKKLAIGMAVRNATLEQLGKVKEEEIITVSAKAAGEELLHGLPSVLNKNNSIPQVHCAIRYLSRSKLLPDSQSSYQSSTARDSCHQQPSCGAAVRSDKRGVSRGTGPSLHEQQCCQAAPRRGSSEARANKEMRLVTNEYSNMK